MQGLNPYVVGNSVGGSEAFVGREDILRNVHDILNNPQQNAILLHGQRRIGKTSILGKLETQLQQEGTCYPIFFDLLGKAHQPVEKIIQELANKISDVLGQEQPQLGDNPQAYFRQIWLPEMLKNAKNPFILLFDEFEALDDDGAKDTKKDTKTEFFHYLYDLVALDQKKLNFVFVIGRNIADLTKIALALFKGIPTKKVSLLNQADTFKLIELSKVNQTLSWSTKAKNRVWQLTQGHPFLTQQVCHCVWEQLYQGNVTKPPQVLPKHIEQVMPTVLERSEGAINWLWDGLEAAQKVFISGVAQASDKKTVTSEGAINWLWNGLEAAQKVFISGVAQASDKKTVTKEQLDQSLFTIGIKISVPALVNAPQSLQENWDLITEDKKGGYSFQVELLRCLVAKYKPLHSVKDELNRLEPEANDSYQKAIQLNDDKKLDEALEALGRVLRLNPNHIEAFQLQAKILEEQGKLEEATEMLKKFFEYHPDEARPLLVQTLWNQAQLAEREGEKLNLYEKILQYDKNHIEAKKKIQMIRKQRAERALRDDDCNEAIKAYQTAGLNQKALETKKKCLWDKYSKLIIQLIAFSLVLFLSYLATILQLDINIPWWLWGSGLGIIIAFLVGKMPRRKTRDDF